MNVAPYPIQPILYFYDQEGTLIDPESVVDITGDLEIAEDGSLSVSTEMEPLGELTIATHGRGEPVSGSVRVVSDGPIGGFLRFDIPGIGVAGVGASAPVALPAQPVNAPPVLSRSARTRQPQSRQVVSGSGVQPRNSL